MGGRCLCSELLQAGWQRSGWAPRASTQVCRTSNSKLHAAGLCPQESCAGLCLLPAARTWAWKPQRMQQVAAAMLQ